jgi:hypothetical protein
MGTLHSGKEEGERRESQLLCAKEEYNYAQKGLFSVL